MKSKVCFSLLTALFIVGCNGGSEDNKTTSTDIKETKPKNVLIIYADDLGWGASRF